MTKPIPEGYHTVTPTLTVRGAANAIEFYKKAFGAQEINRFPGPDGKSIMHAEIKIGDSRIMLNDEHPQMGCMSPQSVGGASSGIFLYVENTDDVFNRAISAGAKSQMAPMDAFWGDRFGSIVDPFGHVWAIATRKKDMTPDELKQAGEKFMKEMKETH
ncbi:Glyoxalase family protein [Candidatus Nitrosotalea sp. FS]|uniref:VOC family protein n=1 Tax=Candidatus Nitrosotalea sp. FS TaxID=2341021 RepID=UPI00140C8AF4|nr:VOC family protein [Candidatus Nitrosotalea sp. FS]NHH96962.1 Glyoxalase family protein [Candidatus Nitrosotalea sp. FS]